MFTQLVNNKIIIMQREDVSFCRRGLQGTLFLSFKANLLQSLNFLFNQLSQNITKFWVVVFGPWPVTLAELHFAK